MASKEGEYSGHLPEYKMSYEDRLREEAWAIAGSRKVYQSMAKEWEPWMLNVVTVDLAKITSGERGDLEIAIPGEEDYAYARERVDEKIEESNYSLERLRKARLVYVPTHIQEWNMHPWNTELNASWNGMRDPLSVDEFFHFSEIPEEELKMVFRFDQDNAPPSQRVWGGYFGFVDGGKQRLADLVRKPIAFVQIRDARRNSGRWDLGSRLVYTPNLTTECLNYL